MAAAARAGHLSAMDGLLFALDTLVMVALVLWVVRALALPPGQAASGLFAFRDKKAPPAPPPAAPPRPRR